MTSFIAHTTVDCHHAYDLCQWWKQLLGYVDLDDDPNLPGHAECLIRDPETGHQILFLETPDAKTIKNRVHFDVRPRERTRAEEVAWAVSIGARIVEDHSDHYGPGVGWTVLADPEGNEFCILRSLAEISPTSS